MEETITEENNISELNVKVNVKLKTTATGFTININKDDTKLWEDALISYFNAIDGYEVEEKQNTTNITIGVKNTNFRKKKDFTITIYKSTGTVLVQTRKWNEFKIHIDKLAEILNVEISNNNIMESYESSETKEIKYKISKDDQVIITENMENTMIKILETLDNQNIKIAELENTISSMKTENDELRTKVEKYDVNNLDWVNKRYEMLRRIPLAQDENNMLKLKFSKHVEDIKIINIRLNNIEQGFVKKSKLEDYNNEQQKKEKIN